MENERIINGKRCRLYQLSFIRSMLYFGPKLFDCAELPCLWVAESGDYVALDKKDGGPYKDCALFGSRFGPYLKELGDATPLDEVVISLFGTPYPRDGKRYMINHKDGNWMNCNYQNLEWVPYHYRSSAAPKEVLFYEGELYEVASTGTVIKNNSIIPVRDYYYDSKYGYQELYLEPHIDLGLYTLNMENIMEAAGYVQGDNSTLQSPAILHRDGDYKNYNSGNLEWVEETDSRYVSYLRRKKQEQLTKMKEILGDKPVPHEWEERLLASSTSEHFHLAPFSPENSHAPFIPPIFGLFGEIPGGSENPFKPI